MSIVYVPYGGSLNECRWCNLNRIMGDKVRCVLDHKWVTAYEACALHSWRRVESVDGKEKN